MFGPLSKVKRDSKTDRERGHSGIWRLIPLSHFLFKGNQLTSSERARQQNEVADDFRAQMGRFEVWSENFIQGSFLKCTIFFKTHSCLCQQIHPLEWIGLLFLKIPCSPWAVQTTAGASSSWPDYVPGLFDKNTTLHNFRNGAGMAAILSLSHDLLCRSGGAKITAHY